MSLIFMNKTKKEQYALIAFSLFPCIVWGLAIFASLKFRFHVSYPKLLCYTAYWTVYLLRTLIYLSLLRYIYKKWLTNLYYTHEKVYVRYSLLAIISIVFGFFVKTEFWHSIIGGCFVSPFIEEVIARFVLYGARKHSWKLYTLVALLSSFTFSLMHIGNNHSILINPTILPKLSEHFLFGLILCTIFWFFPRLSLLISIHAISNLWGTLATELGYAW